MSICPVCDAEIEVLYNGRYESHEHSYVEKCPWCDYEHTYDDGLHTVRVQTIQYQWLETDQISFHMCASAIADARQLLHVV